MAGITIKTDDSFEAYYRDLMNLFGFPIGEKKPNVEHLKDAVVVSSEFKDYEISLTFTKKKCYEEENRNLR